MIDSVEGKMQYIKTARQRFHVTTLFSQLLAVSIIAGHVLLRGV
jgi:hypothetical protein